MKRAVKAPAKAASRAPSNYLGGFVLLFCAALAVYWPAMRGGLLLDDAAHITRPELQSFPGLWHIWFHLGSVPQYYPILHSAFWLEHRLWGDAVLGYHLTNLVLHALAACLVVMLARRLALPGAWLAGFLFALHPVLVESVAWISEQKSTLSAVFYLAAALAYLDFDRTRRKQLYFVALGLFLLALMSKTVTATLPAALLVVFWWQRGKLSWQRDVLPLAPWLAVGATAGLFTAWVERRYIGAEGPDFVLTVGQRFLLAGRAIWFYFAKLVWPAGLTFLYPRWTLDPAVWWQYLFPLGIGAVAAGLVLLARRNRGPLAGFLFFAGTLFPVLGFLNVYPFLYSFVADHYQYLASLGVIVPAAAGLTLAARRHRLALGGVLLAVLGLLTWRQSTFYQDSITLYSETVARNPGSWLAQNNLGRDLVDSSDRTAEGISHLEAALSLKPNPTTHDNLGYALAKTGRMEDALSHFDAALQLDPGFGQAHYNRGLALAQMGRLPEAIPEFRTALHSMPGDPLAHNNLGGALARVGRLSEAVDEFDAALRANPDYAEAHFNRGLALSNMDRVPDALAEFQAAIRLDPDNAPAHAKLGNVLVKLGRLPEAIAAYEAALRIRPDPALQELVNRFRAQGAPQQ